MALARFGVLWEDDAFRRRGGGFGTEVEADRSFAPLWPIGISSGASAVVASVVIETSSVRSFAHIGGGALAAGLFSHVVWQCHRHGIWNAWKKSVTRKVVYTWT